MTGSPAFRAGLSHLSAIPAGAGMAIWCHGCAKLIRAELDFGKSKDPEKLFPRKWPRIEADKGKMLNNELTYCYELDNFKLQTYSP
jgi:hypothetical protein